MSLPLSPSMLSNPAAFTAIPVVFPATTDDSETLPLDGASLVVPQGVKGCEFNELYLILARLCVAVAGLTSFVSILIAGNVFHLINTQVPGDEGTSFTWAIIGLLYFLVMLESCLCFLTMVICFGVLFSSPHRILVRSLRSGGVICLCFTLLVLFACCAYTAAVPLFAADFDDRIMPPPTTCVVSVIRMIALASFLCVLIKHTAVADNPTSEVP